MADIKINTAVSPSLHPAVVDALDGYTDATAPYLEPVKQALADAYTAIGDVHNARAVAEKDSSLTDAAKILRLAKMGEAHQDRVMKRYDAAYKTLTTQIEAMENQLSAPLKAAAERVGISGEVRAHVKAMNPTERISFVEERMRAGDTLTCQMILGSMPFLSGLSDEMAKALTLKFNHQAYPEVAKRLQVSKAAAALMERTGVLISKEMVKAVGADWAKVKRLREASNASEQAFIVRDATTNLPV